jgi:site-specific recombinase XerC
VDTLLQQTAHFQTAYAYLRLTSRRRAAISSRTLLRYAHALKPLFDYLWQPERTTNLLQADVETLEAFVSHLSAPIERSGKKRLARNSIDLVIVATRALFRALVWAGAIRADPAAALRPPDLPRNERQPYLPAPQLERLRLHVSHAHPAIAARDAAILELGASTMLRANEIVTLNLEDVDLETNHLRFYGKGGKVRRVPLTPIPKAAIELWLEYRHQLEGSRQSPALFLSASARNRGGRMSYHGVYAMVRRALKEFETNATASSLGGVHTLRRSGATRFYHRHRDLTLLMPILGHENLSTTQRYVRLDLSPLEQALLEVEAEPAVFAAVNQI